MITLTIGRVTSRALKRARPRKPMKALMMSRAVSQASAASSKRAGCFSCALPSFGFSSPAGFAFASACELAGAGLDVYEHGTDVSADLRALPNVVLLPHMGSATVEGRIEQGEKVIINIKTFADGHRPPDQVVPGML